VPPGFCKKKKKFQQNLRGLKLAFLGVKLRKGPERPPRGEGGGGGKD